MDLLLQFQHILESDPLMDEVGFVHPTQFATLAEDSTGDAAISDGTTFWCEDHKLGVSTQAVLPLYNAAKRAFIAAMEEYKRLGDGHDGLESEVMKHSRALLLLSSDFGTAWNSRRWVIKSITGKCSALQEILDKESELVEKIAEV